MRQRRILLVVTFSLLAGALVAALLTASRIEARLWRQIHGLASRGVSVREVRFSWLRPLRLEGVALRSPALPGELSIDEVRARWSLWGGRDARSHLRGLDLRGLRLARGPLVIEWPETRVDVVSWARAPDGERVELRQRGSRGQVEIHWPARPGGRATLVLSALDVSGTRVAREGTTVLDPGRWSGRASLSRSGVTTESEGALSGESVRMALAGGAGAETGYGTPTSVALEWNLIRRGESVEIRRAVARMGGLNLQARGRLDRASPLRVDLDLWSSSELGALFRTTGLALPAPLGDVRGSFGIATLDVTLKGPLADPASLRVVPRLRFESSAEAAGALRYLQGPFRYTPEGAPNREIDVREGAPDFVPLDQVPPFFVQAVVLSEDAGFFGHPGIDVAEIPVAWATNLDRGRTARGASTITQQLARNLFLSKDKSWGRKLTEAGLALVLDAAVPKRRLLEIYLNVIEWGPGLYGLGPAVQHYFGKTPSTLTAKETAFLICLIPSPVRYHQAHLAGQAGPGMEQLMANLLAKLRAAGALSEREYQSALAETLSFRPETAEAP
jgi:hypothetical protein